MREKWSKTMPKLPHPDQFAIPKSTIAGSPSTKNGTIACATSAVAPPVTHPAEDGAARCGRGREQHMRVSGLSPGRLGISGLPRPGLSRRGCTCRHLQASAACGSAGNPPALRQTSRVRQTRRALPPPRPPAAGPGAAKGKQFEETNLPSRVEILPRLSPFGCTKKWYKA